MKSLVIYYSLEGNCELIANLIKAEFGSDILRLKPIVDLKTHGLLRYAWGGKQALMKEKPELEKININLAEYELFIIGTPVWGFTFTPAINTFLSENKIENKKVFLFCTHAGVKGNTLNNLKKSLPKNEFLGQEEFYNPLQQNRAELIKKIKNLPL